MSSAYLGRAILPGLAVCNNIQIIFNFQVICLSHKFPIEAYSGIPIDGLSRCSPPQEKKENSAAAKLRFCNDIKQLGRSLTNELNFTSGREGESV